MSTRKQSPRDTFYNTARTLFWERGFRKVTVAELSTAASLSKMTFYRHFNSKNDFVQQFFKRYFTEGMDAYRAIIASDRSFKEKLHEIVLFKRAQVQHMSGAMFCDFQDFSDSQLVVTYTHLSLALTRDFFQQAQAQGAVRPEVNIEMLLLLMKEINQLAYTPEMRALYPSQEAMIVDMTNFFFYGLSGK